ncbi:MAG: ABC transporter permease subunit, partial [Pseudomonadota bacterium]|nr:ABC transporter permease subunit [Pseudomonadota bacterium]
MTTETLQAPAPRTPLQEFWHYFKGNKGAVSGLVFIIIICLMALFADVVAPHSPSDQARDALLLPPAWMEGGNWAYVLGTDDVGRDILSRIIHGARLSLSVGLVAVTASLLMGILLGLVAGYCKGVVDTIIMRVVDIMLAMPSLLLAIAIVAILGPSIVNAALAISIVSLPHYVRLTRAATMAEMSRDYVTSSRVIGASPLRLMFICILPNCVAPLIVQAT